MIGIKDQYFGTEIEMTGITRQRAAEVVAEMFGTEAYYDGTTYGIWSVIDLEGKKWKFMSDGSIYTQRKVYGRIVDAGREYSIEMVSPKLSYDEMGKLQEVVRCLRRHGGFVNESCGQHVHIDASNHTPQSLKNALTIMYAKEALFKDSYESLIGNCDEFLYLGGNEKEGHKYVSELLGKETLDTNTYGQTKGRSGSYSVNYQQTGRELLTPDEIRLLDNRKAILFIRGERPIMDDTGWPVFKKP